MLTPWRIELANLPSESESGTQKTPRKIGKKSVKISRVEILQTTHDHPEKCVAKSERNPSKSLAWRYCKQPMIIQKNVSQNRKGIRLNLSRGDIANNP